MNKKLEEWLEIFRDNENVYIYGAKVNAAKLYKLAMKTQVEEKVRGFVVTNLKDNTSELMGKAVKEAREIDEDNCIFLVPQLGEELELEYPSDESWEKSIEEIKQIADSKSEEQIRKDEQFCKKIKEYLMQNASDFSGDDMDAYQSLEIIGLKGQRNTLYRIYKYKLLDILNKEQVVLNIGSNTGFLDASIAKYVKNITGIEYDSHLMNVANMVKDYLAISNTQFHNDDFVNWVKENSNNKYDVIFSLAVHHWLNLKSEDYVEIIDRMLKENGYFVFESHAYDVNVEYGSVDLQWDECVAMLLERNYTLVHEGIIKDDGVINRKFCIIKKEDR